MDVHDGYKVPKHHLMLRHCVPSGGALCPLRTWQGTEPPLKPNLGAWERYSCLLQVQDIKLSRMVQSGVESVQWKPRYVGLSGTEDLFHKLSIENSPEFIRMDTKARRTWGK